MFCFNKKGKNHFVFQSKLVRENDADIRTWLNKCNTILQAETGKTIPELKTNLEGQRDILQTWPKSSQNLASIHLQFRFGKFDPIKINRLPNGDINVPDGQHRLIAIQYLWKELMDETIEVPYYGPYVKYLFHQEYNKVKGFKMEDAKEVLAELSTSQKTINQGRNKVFIADLVGGAK